MTAQAVLLLERGHTHRDTVTDAIDHPTHASATLAWDNKTNTLIHENPGEPIPDH